MRAAVGRRKKMDENIGMMHLEAQRGLGDCWAQGSLEKQVTGRSEECGS